MSKQFAPSRCEWDPANNRPAGGDDQCPNTATLGVGTGRNNWHLCESCAVLPRFKRLRRRDPLPWARAQEKASEK